MSIESNKALVKTTWTAFAKGDLKTAFDNMAEEVSWLVPGTTPGVSGLKKGKQAIRDFMAGVGQVFPEGLQTEIRKIYGDGDTVIVELTNKAKVSNGKFYENDYCFVFEVENGKVRRIREYADTQKAKEILFG